MKIIYSETTAPQINLAREEYFLVNGTDEYFLVWQNKPAVIIGISQNTLKEINTEIAEKDGIETVRRITGGGAVYHDFGNVNFTFIRKKESEFADFEVFCRLIIDFLKTLGINAEMSSRNDMTIDGKKFSGNAQSVKKTRILHHGTLLFDSDLSALSKVLNVKKEKIESKGVNSVVSRVTNILPHLKEKMTTAGFIKKLVDYSVEYLGGEMYKETDAEKEEILKLKSERYDTKEWNFSNNPPYTFENEIYSTCGSVECFVKAEKGVIKNVKIFGDFFGERDVKELEEKLAGISHTRKSLEEAFCEINLDEYIKNIKTEEFLKLLLQNGVDGQ